ASGAACGSRLKTLAPRTILNRPILSDKWGIPFAQPATIYCGVPSTDSSRLRAGEDYPTDLSDFDRFFPDEAACLRYLERLRWPEGFVCPKCSHAGEAWRMKRGLLLCPKCRAQTSVTAGTIFEGTR